MNSTNRNEIVQKRKEDFLQLIVKQKTAALDRREKRLVDIKEEDLLRFSNQPVCQPKKLTSVDAIPMNDDDFLLAELNGHFQ